MLINLRRVFSMTTLTALGHIHCHIGATQQGCNIEAMFRYERDANASSYGESIAINSNRGIERANQGTCSLYCSLSICLGKYNGKLIPTQTGYEVTWAQVTLQALADLL